jgi:hypothetical protein
VVAEPPACLFLDGRRLRVRVEREVGAALLLAAAAGAATLDEIADVTRIDAMRLSEIVVAPAFSWAQLGAPLDPERDTSRLVDSALLASRG